MSKSSEDIKNTVDARNEGTKPEGDGIKNVRHRRRRRAAAVIGMVLAVVTTVAVMQTYLCIPYSYDENRVVAFHKEPQDSIDVLLIGSSATYSGFSASRAYEEYGFTSYPYAIGGATCTMWKLALMDAMRTQHPKLVVVDVFGGGYDREMIDKRYSQVYTVMSHYPLCGDKIEMAHELSGMIDKTSAFSMIFPFYRCHGNVPASLRHAGRKIRAVNFGPSPLKGIENRPRTKKLAHVKEASLTSETMPLDSKTEGIIRDFMEFCHEKDIKVLFVKYPTVLTDGNKDELKVNRRGNRILEIADEYGFATLNMQHHFHDMGLREREDYYNHGHPNVRGQRKVTDYLGGYMQDELGVGPSELPAPVRAEWDESVDYYHAYVDLSEELIGTDEDEALGDSPELVKRLSARLEK